MVARSHRGKGIATQLVAIAREHAAEAGCEWLHVDFDDELQAVLLRSLRLHADQRRPDRAAALTPDRYGR